MVLFSTRESLYAAWIMAAVLTAHTRATAMPDILMIPKNENNNWSCMFGSFQRNFGKL